MAVEVERVVVAVKGEALPLLSTATTTAATAAADTAASATAATPTAIDPINPNPHTGHETTEGGRAHKVVDGDSTVYFVEYRRT